VFSHFADGFISDKIGSLKLDARFILDFSHKTDRVKGAQAEIKLKIVFTLDFVNFNEVFKDFNKLFDCKH